MKYKLGCNNCDLILKMSYLYSKLVKIFVVLLVVTLIEQTQIVRAQEGEDDRNGFITALKDRDFSLVLDRYKTQMALLILSPCFICCACCVLVSLTPCIFVLICGCGVLIDEAGGKKRRYRESDNKNVVVIERRGDIEMCRTEQAPRVGDVRAPPPEVNPYQNQASVYPYLTPSFAAVDLNKKMQDLSQQTHSRKSSISVDQMGKEISTRFNFLSMDDLDKIEKRAREYTLKRVKIGESKV